MSNYHTIEGLESRDPVGAVLTIGVKALSLPDNDPLFQSSPKLRGTGSPVYADRFWIVSRFEDERRVRPLLPEFRRFNSAPAAARLMIHGNFTHATIGEVFDYHLRAQKLPKPEPNPVGGRPACQGDGIRATRYGGKDASGSDTWSEIECPNRMCVFRQGRPTACKPFGRLYFMPRWDHYNDPEFHGPRPLMKWATGSWANVASVQGFFDHVSRQAEQLGIIPPRPDGAPFNPLTPIYGLPFSLALGRKTQAQEGRAFPVVAISPEVNLVDFFCAQRERLAAIGGRLVALPAGGALSPVENEPNEVLADVRQLSPGVPGAVAIIPAEDAEVIAAADREQEFIEGKLEAIGRELDRLCPGKNSEHNREAIRFSCFKVKTDAQLRQLCLDALTEGLEQMRAAR